MVEFRKRLNDRILGEINEMIIDFNGSDDPGPGSGSGDGDPAGNAEGNSGTLILDAMCAPQNIAFPQDVNLLNKAREDLEAMIDVLCHEYNYYKPRLYRQNARKDYLSLAKCRKRPAKRIRKAIKSQLQYVRRDIDWVDSFLAIDGVCLDERHNAQLATIRKLIEQQQYMYDNKVHSIPDRIVSISQPYVRPIVRGKAKSPVEFGAKLDLSIDEKGMARLERLSFDAYNESDVLIAAINGYFERTGHYPERVLADQIYRNRVNRAFCKERGIRISGPALGRPRQQTPEERKQSCVDNTDRIEVERAFSLAKRKYGLGLIEGTEKVLLKRLKKISIENVDI